MQLWLGLIPVRWQLLPQPELLLGQIEAIRTHLEGSYTDLLVAMLHDPALQVVLNGPANRRGRPNENLARELLELFSLGQGHDSERDVMETARTSAGFQLTPSGLVRNPRRHDAGPKRIPGRTDGFDLTPIPPLTLALPAPATRDTLAQLSVDPVWQLA